MLRIVLAGVAAAVAMFVWMGIAHNLPIGKTGITPLPGQPGSVEVLHGTVGDTSALYAFPYDPAATEMPTSSPSGLIVYRAGSWGMDPMTTMVPEFVLELVQCLILAGILAHVAFTFGARLGWGIAAGVMVAIATNGSYHIWYGFPLDYTLAQIGIGIVGYAVASLVATLILPRRAAAAAA